MTQGTWDWNKAIDRQRELVYEILNAYYNGQPVSTEKAVELAEIVDNVDQSIVRTREDLEAKHQILDREQFDAQLVKGTVWHQQADGSLREER